MSSSLSSSSELRTALDRLHPFHMVLDAELHIVHSGPLLHQFLGRAIEGCGLLDAFCITEPSDFSSSEPWDQYHDVFLQARNSSARLRGQFITLEEKRHFIGEPWFTLENASETILLPAQAMAHERWGDYLLTLQLFEQQRQDLAAFRKIMVQRNLHIELYREHLEDVIGQYRDAQEEIKQAQERELVIGSQIQRALLFGDIPNLAGPLSIACHTEPSLGIDGDFYDFFRYSPYQIDISIGDVMGKGIPAALVGAAVKQQMYQTMAEHLARSSSGLMPEPAELVNTLNERISERLIEVETFVTLAYLRYDFALNQISIVDAGHTPLLLINADGVQAIKSDNLPLGVITDEIYTQREVAMQDGDMLFLYSDGFTEASNAEGVAFGDDRLQEQLTELHRTGCPGSIIIQAIRYQVKKFEVGDINDDRTAIALQINPTTRAGLPPRTFELQWNLVNLEVLRHEITIHARSSKQDERLRDALILAAYETATNIIRHNKNFLPDATLHIRLQCVNDAIEVEIFYVGNAFAPEEIEPDFSGESEGGFGLYIIRNSVESATFDNPATDICRIILRQPLTKSTRSTNACDA